MATQATNLITIAVKPATSYLPGTVGWVQQQLRQVNLEVRADGSLNGRSHASLFYGIGGKPTTLLAFIGKCPTFGMRNGNSTSYVAYPAPNAQVAHRIYALDADGSNGKEPMFAYLTPAAYKLVDAFLDEAVQAFRAALDHDDEVPALEVRVSFSPTAE